MQKRMKNEKLNARDDDQSGFAAAARHRNHSISKTIPFADISYGVTVSLNASLNSQLRFLSPAITGGKFSLLLVDTDGSAVATNRAARVRVYATTNVALPIFNWALLTNSVVASNGLLRVDGLSTSNAVSGFFRAAETP